MISDRTNAERAADAAIAVDAFLSACRTDEPEVIADLICNLLHLRRRALAFYGLPFDAAAFAARAAAVHDDECRLDSEGEPPSIWEGRFAESPDY